VKPIRSASVLLSLVLALIHAPSSADQVPTPEPLAELRAAGRYAAAVDSARARLTALENDPGASEVEVGDARRLVEMLEDVAARPEADRRILSRADSLIAVGHALLAELEYDKAETALAKGLELRRAVLRERHPGVGDALYPLAYVCWRTGRYAEGEGLLRDVLEIRRSTLGEDHPLTITTQQLLGNFLQAQGEYDEARAVYEKVLERRRVLVSGDDIGLAESMHDLACLLWETGDLLESERLHAESHAMFKRLLGEDHWMVASSHNNYAVLLNSLGDHAGAREHLEQSLAFQLAQEPRRNGVIAIIYGNLASLSSAIGDLSAAVELRRQGIALRRAIGRFETREYATELSSLGSSLFAVGAYGEAEAALNEALATWRSLPEDYHPDMALGLALLARLSRQHGDYVKSEQLCREALEIHGRSLDTDHEGRLSILDGLAASLTARGEYEAAEAILRDALETEVRVRGSGTVLASIFRIGLGSVLAAQGDPVGGAAFLRQELAVRDSLPLPDPSYRGRACLELARAELLAGRARESRNAAELAVKVFEAMPTSAVWRTGRALSVLGASMYAAGEFASAESTLVRACGLYDANRLRIPSGQKRAWSSRSSPYSLLAAARLRQGKGDEAWSAAERALARSLADVVSGTAALEGREATRRDSLRMELTNIESRLAGATRLAASGDSAAADLADALRSELMAREAAWARFQTALAERHPVTEGGVAELDVVQGALTDGRALVGWLDVTSETGSGEAWCYVVRSTGPVTWLTLPVAARNRADMAESRREVRAALSDPETPELVASRRMREIAREWAAGLTDALVGIDEVVFVPGGALLGVPIEVVPFDDGRLIGDACSVTYAPSATVFAVGALRADRSGAEDLHRALFVADPPFSAPNAEAIASLPRLRGTRDEVASIAPLWSDATVLVGERASERELTAMARNRGMADFDVVHVATHALVSNHEPSRSALVLSQTDLSEGFQAVLTGERFFDGQLSGGEIAREWELDAELVVLSACETGLGREIRGEGYVGFAHTFIGAGARSVLASLWRADDAATALLMRRFYENWLGKYEDDRDGRRGEAMSKAAALREAKLWLRGSEGEHGAHPYEHPYFWSAFVLVGDPR